MKTINKKTFWVYLSIVVINIVILLAVILSVVTSLQKSFDSSYNLNVENIMALTESSADKMFITLDNTAPIVKDTANYINNYNIVGMTETQIITHFEDYYGDANYTWQLIDGEVSGDETYAYTFNGRCLNEEANYNISYNTSQYPMLAKIFNRANSENLGKIEYSSEFTDVFSLKKVFTISTYIRVLDSVSSKYTYKTLMFVLDSQEIDAVISNKRGEANLTFDGYSNIIIDFNGSFVMSNEHFQGSNLTNYLSAFNTSFARAEKTDLLNKLQNGEIVKNSITYKNNKEQDCLFTFSKVKNIDWYVLSMVPKASFHNVYNFLSEIGPFAISFSALFVLDMFIVFLFTRALKKKSLETEKANVAKSNFLSSMSHDIRTPLNAIIGMTIVIDKYLEQQKIDVGVIGNYMKTIEISSNHLLSLINDILDISKIESGTFELQSNEFSIANSLNNVIATQHVQIKSKSLELETHVSNVKNEFVVADELKINQIFINILNNAIKYTESGGKIIVKLSEEKIADKEGYSRYIYQVSDTGIGMDEQLIGRIFQRFVRADDPRSSKNQGSGIGLTIVKEIVDAMHGTIDVQSKVDVGSTFTVSLDIMTSKRQPTKVKFDNLSALIVDDDKVILQNTKRDLQDFGIKTDCAKNGKEALKLFEEKRKEKQDYKIVFVDWYMDAMPGSTVIKHLRSKYGKKLIIIVITAYDIIEIEQEAKKLGANLIISKPLFKSKLTDAITQALNPISIEKEKVDYSKLKILVAEDNDINWLTLSKILDFSNIKAERAENGKIAFEMVKDNDQYDLILMDLQMPIMDGYEATKKIRSLPNKNKASVPIYAMTADIFASNIQSCIENGMDGHLAKPIELDKFTKVLKDIYNKKLNNDKPKKTQ